MKLTSREYKVMLDPEAFADRKSSLRSLAKALGGLAKGLDRLAVKGDFDETAERTIHFLDTPDLALRREGFVLRRRMTEKVEYTLKCRSEDRYFAAGADLRTVNGFKTDEKLEEDLAPPFHCRFSHSNTVRPPKKSELGKGVPPKTLAEAADIFPILGSDREETGLRSDTPLRFVNDFTAYERVFTGLRLRFKDGRSDGADVESSVALILWTDGKKGAPLVAELSFRLEDKKERFSRELSKVARAFYEAVQGLDCARPQGTTKTSFVYRDAEGD